MRLTSNIRLVFAGSLLALAPLTGGCALLQTLGFSGKADRAEPSEEVGPLANATCEAHWSHHPSPPLTDPEASAADKVTDALCWPLARNDPREGAEAARQTRMALDARKRPYVQGHFAFEERHPDPLQASLMVTACIDHGTCEAKRSYVVGQMAAYAVAPREVEQALASVELPAAVKTAYVERYTAAAREVLTLADAMPADDVEICRTLPEQIRARRQDDYESFADHYTRFDALWPQLSGVMAGEAGDATLLASAVALRDEHVDACFARSTVEPLACWNATLARPLTEAITRMAVRQGDAPRARVELETLKAGPDLFAVANEISYAQTKALGGGSSRAYTAWDLMPSIPEDRELAQQVAALDSGVEWVTAKVEALEPTKDATRVRFETLVSKTQRYICKDTDKIDRIEDGKVYYKQSCRPGKLDVKRTAYEPVTVPSTDTLGLVPRQLVRVVVEPKSRRGYLLEALGGESLGNKRSRVRLRSTPLTRG